MELHEVMTAHIQTKPRLVYIKLPVGLSFSFIFRITSKLLCQIIFEMSLIPLILEFK